MSTSAMAVNGKSSQRLVHRLTQWVKRNPKKSLGFSLLGLGLGYQTVKGDDDDTKDTRKKVLVVPFERITLTEDRQRSLRALLSKPPPGNDSSGQKIEMPLQELVEAIHQAAQDENIVALYGTYNGEMGSSGIATAGWGHLEELRNALLVFQQSHRTHYEPKRNFTGDEAVPKDSTATPKRSPKPMFLFANTLAAPRPNADMKEYYIASVFGNIWLQPQGDLNLLGLHTTSFFVKEALQKYGVQVDVWKHGLYKNAANMFTHTHYSKEHYENTSNLLKEIQNHIWQRMYYAPHSTRHFAHTMEFSSFWKMVHQAGSFPAAIAQQVGFIDAMPQRDPLDDLLKQVKRTKKGVSGEGNSTGEEEQEALFWTPPNAPAPLTPPESAFPANAEGKISIFDYVRQQERKQQRRHRQNRPWYAAVQGLWGNASDGEENEPPTDTPEQIAVLKIGGPITDSTARKMTTALRKLQKEAKKKNIKALVLRVDSPGGSILACEKIHQELKAVKQPIVVSYGNVSASGGVYITCNTAKQIFASPTTITGSIGVVMLRLNLQNLAQQYGVTVDSIPTSDLSGSFDPFTSANNKDAMKSNFANFTTRAYMRFKTLVAQGRQLDIDKEVEPLAQGKVWSGSQALELGLVDSLGGLDRAIAFAKRRYCSTKGDGEDELEKVQVIAWPPKQSILEFLVNRKRRRIMGNDGDDDDGDGLDSVEVPSSSLGSGPGPQFLQYYTWMLARYYLNGETSIGDSSTGYSPSMASAAMPLSASPYAPMLLSKLSSSASSGVLLTLDENVALRCWLQDNDMADLVSDLPPSF